MVKEIEYYTDNLPKIKELKSRTQKNKANIGLQLNYAAVFSSSKVLPRLLLDTIDGYHKIKWFFAW